MKKTSGDTQPDPSLRRPRSDRSEHFVDFALRKSIKRPWLFFSIGTFALCVPAAALLWTTGLRLRTQFVEEVRELGEVTEVMADTIRSSIADRVAEIEEELVDQFPGFTPRRLSLTEDGEVYGFEEGEHARWEPSGPLLGQVLEFGRSPWSNEPEGSPRLLIHSRPGPPSRAWRGMLEELRGLGFRDLADRFPTFTNQAVFLSDLLGMLHDLEVDRNALLAELGRLAGRAPVTLAATSANLGRFLWAWPDPEGPALVIQRIQILDLWDSVDLQTQAGLSGQLLYTFYLLHGFEVDRAWLLEGLVREKAELVLRPGFQLEHQSEVAPEFLEHASALDLGEIFGIEANSPHLGPANYLVTADQRFLARQFWTQFLQLSGGGVLLLGVLGSGIYLMASTFRRELTRTRRMEAFTAAVSHELRTPISTIGIHLDLLRQGEPGDPERNLYFQRIEGELFRLTQLVGGILERAKLTGGLDTRSTTEQEPLEVSGMVSRMRPGLVSLSGGRIEFDLAADLPEVQASRAAVESIVINLVENATKYGTPPRANGHLPSPIRLTTRLESTRVVLEVADRGPGIPAELRQRCFEPFVRFHDEDSGGPPGTGLGLHLVALQAAALSAEVEIADRPGGGAQVRVSFPASWGKPIPVDGRKT